MFQHYIITSFNLPRSNRLDKNGNPTMTPEYMDKRFQLFERFCFPSIYAQTNQNFTWLILFSDKTEEVYRKKIAAYCERLPNLIPLFLDDAFALRWRDFIAYYIMNDLKEPYGITTRLDNDDALNITYVERVQKLVTEKKLEKAFLAFPYGLRYSTRHKIAFKSEPIPFNHYISLVLPNDNNFKLVFFCDHTKLEETGYQVVVDWEEKMMWLEVVHSTNAVNKINPEDFFHPVLRRKKLSEFRPDMKRKDYRIIRYLLFSYTWLYLKLLLSMIRNKLRTLGTKKEGMPLRVKLLRYIKGNFLRSRFQLEQYLTYRKGRRAAKRIYDPVYLDTKFFLKADNVPAAEGWSWAVNDYKARKERKINVGVPFPVSPLNTVWGYENISFDPSDLYMFQGSGKYFQASQGGRIYIGKGSYIANNVGIVTSNHDINDPDLHVAGEDIILGEKCWIAFNAVILPGVVLGDHTTVGAGAIVTKSFPKGYCVIVGNPARVIKRIANNNPS